MVAANALITSTPTGTADGDNPTSKDALLQSPLSVSLRVGICCQDEGESEPLACRQMIVCLLVLPTETDQHLAAFVRWAGARGWRAVRPEQFRVSGGVAPAGCRSHLSKSRDSLV